MAAWAQKQFQLKPRARGCHLVTEELVRHIGDLVGQYDVGVAHLFLQHTSASLSINENCDPSVRADMEATLNRIVPEGPQYSHDDEGPDDMPAHVKSSLLGCSLMIPISGGKLALGTWQGVWLNEHRYQGGARTLVATLQGQPRKR